MSLMRWFRKNNRKIMAIAVVGLMFVFIGGSALRMTCGYGGPRPGKAAAQFGVKNKITLADIDQANRELNILRQMRAEYLLRSHDMQGILLAELLFSENRISPAYFDSLRQAIQANNLRISDEQLLKLTKKTQTDEIYWHLLKKEAETAGIAVGGEAIKNLLHQYIPQLFGGSSYSEVINGFLSRGISEETVVSAFTKLYAVLEYANIACSDEALTRAQISRLVDDELQTINTHLVRVQAELFAEEQDEPDENKIKEQFDKYKTYLPGEVTQDNLYGFGYKLDDRVQLDYICVKLDDVETIIEKPTQQEKEQYYLTHSSEFTEQRPSDPNDPNSPKLEHALSFGQVAGHITSRMTNQRIISKTEEILGRARQLSEAKYGDSDATDLSAEQLRNLAVDFNDIAGKLAEEYSIDVYSGRTGMLTVADVQQDENLSGLILKPAGPDQMPYRLVQLVFSVKPFDSIELALGDITRPKIYQSIGPLIDIQGTSAALVRVNDAKKASVPAGLDVTFSSAKVKLDKSDKTEDEEPYSVRQHVVKDLKILAAMQTAKEKAGEFLTLAQEEDWEKAVDTFNRQYPPDEPDEPNNFQLAVLNNLKKPSADMDEVLAAQNKGLIGARLFTNAHKRDKMIIDTLLSLVPHDSNSPKELPAILEVKPDLGYYCIRNLTINRVDRNEYDRTKTLVAYRQNRLEGQNLSVVHFEPDNILNRMNFRLIKEPRSPAEPNEPVTETAEPLVDS